MKLNDCAIDPREYELKLGVWFKGFSVAIKTGESTANICIRI